MNLTQAEAIASLYTELLSSIDRTKIECPKITGYMYKKEFSLDDINDIQLDGDQVVVSWSQYAGCGDYDRDTTYHRLEDIFTD